MTLPSSSDPAGRPSCRLTIILVLVAIIVGADPLWYPAEGAEASLTRTVQAVTSSGRCGTYYLPSSYDSRTLP